MQIKLYFTAVQGGRDIAEGHLIAGSVFRKPVGGGSDCAVQHFAHGSFVKGAFSIAETVEVLLEIIAQADGSWAFQIVAEDGVADQLRVLPGFITGEDSLKIINVLRLVSIDFVISLLDQFSLNNYMSRHNTLANGYCPPRNRFAFCLGSLQGHR